MTANCINLALRNDFNEKTESLLYTTAKRASFWEPAFRPSPAAYRWRIVLATEALSNNVVSGRFLWRQHHAVPL